MKKLGLSILLVMVATAAWAQFTFEGQVIDESEEPLAGATVKFGDKEDKKIVLTDLDGRFFLENEMDSITVEVSYVGSRTRQVTLFPNVNNTLIIQFENDDNDSYMITCVLIEYRNPPFALSRIGKEEIAEQNLGQDLPFILDQLPSVVTTSDAGTGIGYTGLRVRGSDASRVNVTINGVPLNDSESQGVFWVNMPDFASSLDNAVLVRGAGTSTNGAGAFGASLHLQTQEASEQPYGEYSGSAGAFNTLKTGIEFGTGRINDRFSLDGRLSQIKSDGYIDRATADLESYYVQGDYLMGANKQSNLRFITFGGHEVTYQAWNGVPEALLETDRTFNSYTYENQVDDYQQTHYQLLFDTPMSAKFNLNLGLHYTKGEGFFEEFREGDALSTYGIDPQTIGGATITESDLVRRRWLDNDFYGAIFSGNFQQENHNVTVGGAINRYIGDHFGEVISGQFVPQDRIGENYYFNDAEKNDFNIYSKYTYDFENGLTPYLDLQFRRVGYDFEGLTLSNNQVVTLPQSVDHNFFNPKVGASWDFAGGHNAYASFSVAQKEPNRSDFVDSPADRLPKPEKLNDYELGYSYDGPSISASANLFYMDYKDQLAVTGGVNDVGEYTRVNVDESYRSGIEVQTQWQALERLNISANATFSNNKINSFIENVDDFDNGGAQQVEHNDTDIALSPNIVAGGTVEYDLVKNVRLSFISKYIGDQFLDNTSSESRKIDAYWVNNLAVNTQLANNLGFVKSIEANVRVNNLFDEAYEANGYTFGYIFGGETIYENFYYPQAGTYALAGLNVRF